jgi:outer membrane receptor protein involved in Fe transport
MDHLRNNEGREHAGYLDATLVTGDGLIRSIKFGAKVTIRTENDRETAWNYQQLTPPFGVGLNADGKYQALSAFNPPAYSYLSSGNLAYSELFPIGSLFNGRSGLPASAYFPSVTLLNTNFGTVHSQLGAPGDSVQAVQYAPGDASRQRENTEAVYAMANFRSDDNGFVSLRGNLGVRVVAYNYRSNGATLFNGFATPTSLIPVTGYVAPGAEGSIINNGQSQPNTVQFTADKKYFAASGGQSGVAVLPSFNISLLPTPQLVARLAASRGMSRPPLSQLNPRGSFFGTYVGTYESYFNGNRGNPNLKPEMADQFDASLEWYPSKAACSTLRRSTRRSTTTSPTRRWAFPTPCPRWPGRGRHGQRPGQQRLYCAGHLWPVVPADDQRGHGPAVQRKRAGHPARDRGRHPEVRRFPAFAVRWPGHGRELYLHRQQAARRARL